MKSISNIIISILCSLFAVQAMASCTNQNVNIELTKPNSIYVDNSDNTITDRQTGLMWHKCSLGLTGTSCENGTAKTLTWQAALAAANENNENGFSDWRLPNMNELFSLVEDACSSPSINEKFFPATKSNSYWTSSFNSSKYPLHVRFHEGTIRSHFDKSNKLHVRLVRGIY